MTPEQQQEFRTILERAEFLWVRALVEDREAPWRERCADVRDHASTTAGREMVPGDLGHADSLCEIREALDRIVNGEFGVCTACGQAVGLPRLMAMPWTPLCMECEEHAEAVDTRNPCFNSGRIEGAFGSGPSEAQGSQSRT